MMKCFLTSNPIIESSADLNPINGFIDELKKAIPKPCNALFVCSAPDEFERTDKFARSIKASFEAAGFLFIEYNILDHRNQFNAKALVESANFIILAGGHVPTQNKFFTEIDLRTLMCGYAGVVMGISAGTMNSADIVYAHPELVGEAIDANYQKFLIGLNLTKTMILPHYPMIKNAILDSLRVLEDIAYPDSIESKFYALVDGSYLLIDDGKEELRGEAYLIENGGIARLSSVGDSVEL